MSKPPELRSEVSELKSMTGEKLKAKCRELGLPVSGRKSLLIERICELHGWEPPPSAAASADTGEPMSDVSGHFVVALDIETANSDKWVDSVISLAAVAVDSAGRELPLATALFNTLICPPDNVQFADVNTAIHGLTRAHLANAPPPEAALKNFVEYLERAALWFRDQPENAGKSFSVILCGHNIAAADLQYLYHMFVRHNIFLPTFVTHYWDTLIAMKKKPTHELHVKRWAEVHPHSSLSNKLTCSSLYHKLVFCRPHAADSRVLPGLDHTVLQDVYMCLAVAKQPDVWAWRTQKGAGAKPLSSLFARLADRITERQQQIDQNISLPEAWKAVDQDMKPTESPEEMYDGPKWGPKGAAQSIPPNLVDSFDLFLSHGDLTVICEATYHYACVEPVLPSKVGPVGGRTTFRRCEATHPQATTRCPKEEWLGMTEESLMTFFGICFLMAGLHVKVIHDPWKEDADERIPSIAESMREEVFLQHLKFIHLEPLPESTAQRPAGASPEWYSDDSAAQHAPLDKIRAFLRVLCTRFGQFWDPGLDTVLDETGIGLKRKITASLRVYPTASISFDKFSCF